MDGFEKVGQISDFAVGSVNEIEVVGERRVLYHIDPTADGVDPECPFYASQLHCWHRHPETRPGGPHCELSGTGVLDGAEVTCDIRHKPGCAHGSRWNVTTGAWLEGPADEIPLVTYEVLCEEGAIWVAIESGMDADESSPVPGESPIEAAPEDQSESSMVWRPTNAPEASSRTDDIWFITKDTGWAVNSNGQILKTEDGGESWVEQFRAPFQTYFRCIAFADEQHGWAGTLTRTNRLYRTDDSGLTWQEVTNLPETPVAICGMCVVDRDTIYLSGTNFPNQDTGILKTLDGGATWQHIDMRDHSTNLIDIHFVDAERGWVVGGISDATNPDYEDLTAVVLLTEDGGESWQNLIADLPDLPRGEWGWKIHFVDSQHGFISLEAYDFGAILVSADGGTTWERKEVNDPQGNANLEGIGFITPEIGWVGGWGNAAFTAGFSSATNDGGVTWRDANEIGRFINRFRFIGSPIVVGYASGKTVYKYEPVLAPQAALGGGASPVRFELFMSAGQAGPSWPYSLRIRIPNSCSRLGVVVWNRFGLHVSTLLDVENPPPGKREISWDGTDIEGQRVKPGPFIIRVSTESAAESQIVILE